MTSRSIHEAQSTLAVDDEVDEVLEEDAVQVLPKVHTSKDAAVDAVVEDLEDAEDVEDVGVDVDDEEVDHKVHVGVVEDVAAAPGSTEAASRKMPAAW